jgi:Carboxypeptidase regulatory-like domain
MRTKQAFMAGVAILAAATMTSGAPGGGTVSGKITYEGTPAKQKPIDMSKEPSCAKQYATPPPTETVVTGPNNALVNVVVYISAGAPDEGPPSQPAVFTQKGCRYRPHVLAFQVNQPLEVLNEDQTSHNIHPLAKINREWNKSQPPGTPPIIDKYDKMEFIPVKCNVHPWMHGTFAVLKNSHHAISGEDGGFNLSNLPPGKYTVTAWHEAYGEQSQEVTITGNESKTATFVFKAKPY